MSLQTLSTIVLYLSLISEAHPKFSSFTCRNKYDSMKNCHLACERDTNCVDDQYENSTGICEIKFITHSLEINCSNYQQWPTEQLVSAGPSVQCGLQADKYKLSTRRRKRVIGGRTAAAHSWPWTLRIVVTRNESTRSNCGGSLIRVSDIAEETDIAVTAAHCVAYTDPKNNKRLRIYDEVTVVAGAHRAHEANAATVTRSVFNVRIKQGYKVAWLFNDLAVLKLNEPIKFNDEIRPICLPEEDEPIPANQLCYVVGWGRTQADLPIWPDELQQLKVPVQPPEDCKAGWDNGYYENSNICAGSIAAKATSGVCDGDSGGMLACCKGAFDPWVLYGVASRTASDSCLNDNKPAIFTRVSTNVDFILEAAMNMTSIKRT